MSSESVEIRAALLRLRSTTGLQIAFGGLLPARAAPMRIAELNGAVTGALRGLATVLACVATGSTCGHRLGDGTASSTARSAQVDGVQEPLESPTFAAESVPRYAQSSACRGVPDERYGEEILACVIPRDPADPPTLEETAGYCREQLAHYKVPRRLEIMDGFPMTVSGKVKKVDIRHRFGGSR